MRAYCCGMASVAYYRAEAERCRALAAGAHDPAAPGDARTDAAAAGTAAAGQDDTGAKSTPEVP